MFGQKSLSKEVDQLITLMHAETVDGEAAQKAAQHVMKVARGAKAGEVNDAVSRLAARVPNLSIMRAALLAVTCGALIEERGADMAPLTGPALARFTEAVERAVPFVEACVAEARRGEPSQDADSEGLHAEEAIERFGQQVADSMPDAAQAFGALELLSAAVLAILSRSKPLRKQINAGSPLKQGVSRLAALGVELPCFHEMLSLLDDEQVVVLHPGLARGYLIRIAGIGNNFQLHTLLADALIGDPATGWLPGKKPSPRVAALAKDAPISDPDKLPTAEGAFNLWNWTGLLPDASLPQGQASGSEHWIWNEGVPADIVPFQGTRVILVGPPPYPRAWNSGRFFPSMTGELEVIRQLSAEEAHDWLGRLAAAPKPAPADRYTSPDDITEIPF